MEFKNNARSTVADNPLAAGATTLNVAPGEGDNFPSSFPFLITIWDSSPYPGNDSEMEIVKCTGRTVDALTIIRAQEGTADVAHSNGEKVAMLITAGHLSAILSDLAAHEIDTSTHGITGSILGTEDKGVANGVAALDGYGDLKCPGDFLHLTPNPITKDIQIYLEGVWTGLWIEEGVSGYIHLYQWYAGAKRELLNEYMKDIASGVVGLDANSKQIPAQHFVSVPAAANSTGTAGQMAYDASYFYICTATDTWKRVAIAGW